MARVLIVVDMQNDFVKGHMSTPQAREIIGAVKAKVQDYQKDGQVLFTLDTHLDGDYLEQDRTAEAALLPKHCIQGTEGWEIIDELLPYVAGNRFEKPTFLGLGLETVLEKTLSGTPEDTIELCGVCTDICVLSNALYLRAKYPKAAIVVDGAACAGLNPAAHNAALTAMKSCLIQVK